MLYRVLVFTSSVTGMPSLFITTFRKGVAAWRWISNVAPVEAKMIHFEVFYHLAGGATSTPKEYHFLDKAVQNNIYIYVCLDLIKAASRNF